MGLVGAAPTALAGPADIPLGGYLPSSIALDPISHRVFTVNPANADITVSDTTTDAVIGTIRGDLGFSADDVVLAVDPVLGFVFTAGVLDSSGGGTRHRITVQSEDPASVFDSDVVLAAGVRPTAIAVDYFSHAVFVVTTETSGPFQINRLQRFVPRWLSESPPLERITRLPNGAAADSIAVDPLLGQIYVGNPAAGTVSIIDEKTGSFKTGDVRVGASPHGIGVDPYSHEVYVADSASGSVFVIDGLTRAVTGSPIAVSEGAHDIAVDHRAQKVYVRSGAGSAYGSVAVIDSGDKTVTEQHLVIGPAKAIAVDHLTHTLYAALAGSSAVAVVDG